MKSKNSINLNQVLYISLTVFTISNSKIYTIFQIETRKNIEKITSIAVTIFLFNFWNVHIILKHSVYLFNCTTEQAEKLLKL